MNGWVKADIHYGLPMARLYVTREVLLSNRPGWMGGDVAVDPVAKKIGELGDDPVAMEEYLAGLIRIYRPELVGGSLVAVRFDFDRACWEFLYVHPSLSRGADGMEKERIPLVPSEAGDRPRVVGCPPEHREAAEKLLKENAVYAAGGHLSPGDIAVAWPAPSEDERTLPTPSQRAEMKRFLGVDPASGSDKTVRRLHASVPKTAWAGSPVKSPDGETVGRIESVDEKGQATISIKPGYEQLFEMATLGMLKPISMMEDAVVIEPQPATRRQSIDLLAEPPPTLVERFGGMARNVESADPNAPHVVTGGES